MDWRITRVCAVSALSALLLQAREHEAHADPATPPAQAPDHVVEPAPHAAPNPARPAPNDKTVRMLREAVLSLLKDGNARFAAGRPLHPNIESARQHLSAGESQHPLATIFTCSDSRAPVEFIFDRAPGDLFVVRSAGNLATDDGLASLEYGSEHLTTPVLVVLGHTGCGVISAVAENAPLTARLATLAKELTPVVELARRTPGSDLIATAARVHVQLTVSGILSRCPTIKARADAGLVSVLGAVYHQDSGVVEWLTAPESTLAVAHDTPLETGHAGKPESHSRQPVHGLNPDSSHAPDHTAPPNAHPAAAKPLPDPDDDEYIEMARTQRNAPAPVHAEAAAHTTAPGPAPDPAPASAPAPAHDHDHAPAPIPPPARTLPQVRTASGQESLLINTPISSSTPIGGIIRRPGDRGKKAH